MPQGVAIQPRRIAIPKAAKWQHMLPDAVNQIQRNLNHGWDVAFCYGSHKQTSGLSHAGFSVWSREGDPRNEDKPVPVNEKHPVTRAELRAALLALAKKQPGIRLHVVTDSELVFLGLKGKSVSGSTKGGWVHMDRWLTLIKFSSLSGCTTALVHVQTQVSSSPSLGTR